MIVIEKNPGEKIPYEVHGTKLTFDDELTLNLAKLEKDWPIHKDICMDADGNLNASPTGSEYYVAQVDIPAAEYEPGETEEDPPVKKPLNMDNVVLTLWAIDNY